MADLRNIAKGRSDGLFQGLPTKEVLLLSEGEDKLVIDVEDEETTRGRRDEDYSPAPDRMAGKTPPRPATKSWLVAGQEF